MRRYLGDFVLTFGFLLLIVCMFTLPLRRRYRVKQSIKKTMIGISCGVVGSGLVYAGYKIKGEDFFDRD